MFFTAVAWQVFWHAKTGLYIAGDLVLSLRDATIACETCEELFTPLAPHIASALNGVDIISNGSGSHHQLRSAFSTPSAHTCDPSTL